MDDACPFFMAGSAKESTVVIASSENEALFSCIDSVYDDAHVVVSMTPSLDIEKRLTTLGIPKVVVPRGNLGLTFNAGIEKAQTEKVIIMTDDSRFTSGAIGILTEELDRSDASKAKIIFQSDQTSPISRVIADVRSHANDSPTRIFTPGLAINKRIKTSMGNQYFNEDVRWAEDAEFSYRFKKSGLSFVYRDDAVIIHPPVSLKHDLTGALLIGLSKRRSVELGLRRGDEDFIPTLKRFTTGVSLAKKKDLLENKGLPAVLYGLIWDVAYNAGYNLKKIGMSDGLEEAIWQRFGRGNGRRTENYE